MRKRSIDCWFDNLFWYTIYLLPVIAYLFSLCMFKLTDIPNESLYQSINFDNFMQNFCDLLPFNNVVGIALSNLFGEEGLIPFFNDASPITMLTWFVITYLCHLMVDFILFIPRLCHKWMKAFTRGDD